MFTISKVYAGCFEDQGSRMLRGANTKNVEGGNSQENCEKFCNDNEPNLKWFGMDASKECYGNVESL